VTARTSDDGMVLPGGTAGATARGAFAAALQRFRMWRVPRVPAPSRLWEGPLDGTAHCGQGAMGLALTCRAGTFLVTQEGDPVDHVLEAGDRFRSTSRGRVAAWALRAGTLEIGRARPEATEDGDDLDGVEAGRAARGAERVVQDTDPVAAANDPRRIASLRPPSHSLWLCSVVAPRPACVSLAWLGPRYLEQPCDRTGARRRRWPSRSRTPPWLSSQG
jgi:hypothetical protein